MNMAIRLNARASATKPNLTTGSLRLRHDPVQWDLCVMLAV